MKYLDKRWSKICTDVKEKYPTVKRVNKFSLADLREDSRKFLGPRPYVETREECDIIRDGISITQTPKHTYVRMKSGDTMYCYKTTEYVSEKEVREMLK